MFVLYCTITEIAHRATCIKWRWHSRNENSAIMVRSPWILRLFAGKKTWCCSEYKQWGQDLFKVAFEIFQPGKYLLYKWIIQSKIIFLFLEILNEKENKEPCTFFFELRIPKKMKHNFRQNDFIKKSIKVTITTGLIYKHFNPIVGSSWTTNAWHSVHVQRCTPFWVRIFKVSGCASYIF